MDQDLAGMRSKEAKSPQDDVPEAVPVPRLFVPHLGEIALLLDIDGTLLDLMPTPREVWVPPGLSKTLNGLLDKTSGALALVSGRSLNDIDLILRPISFPPSADMARRCVWAPTMKRSRHMRHRSTRS